MKPIFGRQKEPWKALIYGVPGIGKSTLASKAPKPFMFDLERRLGRIDAHKSEYIRSWEDLKSWMNWFMENDYETAVFDTYSGLEKILAEKILKDDGDGKLSLADFGYQRGFDLLASHVSLFLNMVDMIVDNGRNVLIVGHEKIEKLERPDSENFDRYSLEAHKKCLPILASRMDAILLAKYETLVKNKDEKNFQNKAKKRAVGDGTRLLYTEERPWRLAKNSFNLPEKIPFTLENASSIYEAFV
jgi:hypothetical protein